MLNGTIGLKWAGQGVVTSLKMTNLANQKVMQHIFGDVLKRQIGSEVRVSS